MTDLILTTYDWVPQAQRGYVRDLRIRRALDEASLPCRVESTPFKDRQSLHFAHQPFGQVPWLTAGDLTLFESGAIALRLVDRFDGLADYPASKAYVKRATARPTFINAHAYQLAHFAKADFTAPTLSSPSSRRWSTSSQQWVSRHHETPRPPMAHRA